MIQVNSSFRRDDLPDSVQKFEPGQLVYHQRYGYRGVIVSVDGHCKADPVWYMANQTQPNREQPWYHVLVDGTDNCTYPAQKNLLEDISGRPVAHPWIARFFSGFENGRYIRNDEPWPS